MHQSDDQDEAIAAAGRQQSTLLSFSQNQGLIIKVLQLVVSEKKDEIFTTDDDSLSQVETIEGILDKIQSKSPSDSFAKEETLIQEVLSQILLNSPNRLQLIRVLPTEQMLVPLVQGVLASQKSSLAELLPLMGTLLQYTDVLNFSIMCKIRMLRHQSHALISTMVQMRDLSMAEALVKSMTAQPYLVELIDAVPLFEDIGRQGQPATTLEHLITYLSQLVYPDLESDIQEDKESRNTRLELVQNLLLNKRTEQRHKIALETQLSDQVIEIVTETPKVDDSAVCLKDGSVLATTPYVMDKVKGILKEVEEKPFGHFVIRGPSGSGKMSLLRLADHLLSQRYQPEQPQSSEPQSSSNFIVVTLEESFDSKNLVGTYVCNETGEFVFKKGPLTVAAEQGLWLVLRNIEDTPSDLLSFLLPLVEQNTLQVTSTFTIKPRLGFRIIALTKTEESQAFLSTQEETISPLLKLLKATHLESLMPENQRVDLETILRVKFSPLFTPIQIGDSVHALIQSAIAFISARFNQLKLHLLDYKPPSVTQMFNLYQRVLQGLGEHLSQQQQEAGDCETTGAYLSQMQRQLIIEEIHDIYLSYMYDVQVKKSLIKELVSAVFNTVQESSLDGQIIAEYICDIGREHGSSNEQCFFGRASLKGKTESEQVVDQNSQSTSKFVYTGATVRSLEQICQSTSLSEAILLVGETGTGKTTIVQELAKLMGKTLHVFNMNQNTDSADLLGGFKSVDLKYLLTPVYRLFLEVFTSLLNTQATNNAKFLQLMQKTFEQNQVKEFIQCLNHGLKSIKRSKNRSDEFDDKIDQLKRQTEDLQKRSKKLVGGGGFIFQFVEGTLIKSIQEGDWILLDEINLAGDSVLNKLATIVQGNHILLNERADIVETKKHSDFRIFMCMNPPYSSAGKKQLPLSLRCKLTELYVSELENEADLWDIIDRNTKSLSNSNVSCISEGQKRQILQFYIQVKSEVSKQMRRGNIGLRNLCRALFFIKSAIQLRYPPIKAIYDSLLTCFASHLDQALQESVRQIIMKLFEIKKLPKLITSEDQQDERFVYIEGNVIPKGDCPPENFDEKNFILTPSFKNLLRQLASVVAVSNFAVILEGPTSAGKTSCVQYLAQVTHNKVIRINNHMHTDVQEYLGSYVPDADTGKLVFQEGVLVEAVRHGYWVILDELNLAPSEVLEALNRLLDDNRELHIVETQKVVKAHPRFRIFATQNPTEGYGGRKELSEAFKNRFVLIRVLDVPTEELKEILVQKCSMPKSRASLMIKVMEQLQIYRSQANLFSGKNAIITVRDLLKWAGRVNLNNARGNHMDPEAIATEGFFVLGERSRNQVDKKFIQNTIEKVFNVKIDIDELYESYFESNLKSIFDSVPAELNLPKIIPSKQLKRLAVLVEKCLKNREPVLLVGDTGCGKTTLCQVFASQVTHQSLLQINCHQNTETSDFIGCMRTRKNLKQTQDKLLEILDAQAALLQDQEAQETFSRSKTLKRKTQLILNSLIAQKNDAEQMEDEDLIATMSQIKTLREDLNCVFEWHDGILVEAMQEGGLLLIDEISLANDSVLERLNSVFEQDRVLMVTEKSSREALKIVAHEKFNMVATMNPSGDFGKKELSPALRNRMTEIWVESYFQQPDLLALQKSENEITVYGQVSESIDLFLIVSKLCEDAKFGQNIALAIFNMINFLASCSQSESTSTRFQALKRKSLSIRDILCIIDFMKLNIQKMHDDYECFKEAIELVIIDGICLGIDTAGPAEQQAIIEICQDCLRQIQVQFFSSAEATVESQIVLENSDYQLKASHYSLTKKELSSSTKFAFHAATTQTNLMKLLRAYTLGKPILIEGPPGVGKTALVEQVAKVTGRKLVRVNLSEQTDMMDLLGSEYPTSTGLECASDGEEDQDEIQFRWGDGVLLSAIKEGHWLLIDEMNLAQQSILEGLNAILDHRKKVYIPELNKEFTCHPDFYVFACQNPSQSASSTSGRKTLPKSFLNRFTKIYLNELTNQDYKVILRSIANEIFPDSEQIDWLLSLTQEIENATHSMQEGAVNMRDLSRFLRVYQQAVVESSANQLQAILYAFNSTYLMKQEVTPVKRDKCLKRIVEAFSEQKNLQETTSDLRQQLPETSHVRVCQNEGLIFDGLLKSQINFATNKNNAQNEIYMADLLQMKGPQAVQLQSLSDCLKVNLPILLTTDDTTKMIKCLTLMAGVKNTILRRILLSDRSDTTQLLGCFEQTSQDLSQILQYLQPYKKQLFYTQSIMKLEQTLKEGPIDLQKQIKHVESFLKRHDPIFEKLKPLVSVCKRGVSRFEWVDSVLVKAISEGEWAVFENANICNASILDRLNPLLEEGNQTMVINEQGLDDATQSLRTVQSHEDFRAIFVISKKSLIEQGRDVSRALRNRCVEISITFEEETNDNHQTFGLQQDLEDLKVEKLDARNLDWSLAQLQAQFDLLPCGEKDQETDNAQEVDVQLGKRQRQEVQTQQIATMMRNKSEEQLELDQDRIDQKAAYPFIYVEYADQMQGSEKANSQICEAKNIVCIQGQQQNGWQLYMLEKIKQIQQALKSRLSREIVSKQLQPFFSCLLETPKEDFDLNSLHFLFTSLLKARGLSSSLESPLCVYIATKVQNDILREALSGTVLYESELNFLFQKEFQAELQMDGLQALGPNAISPDQLSFYLERDLPISQDLVEQKIYMFKCNAKRIATFMQNRNVKTSGRVSLTINMLTGELDDEPRKATVILLNAEKEILSQEDMIKQLEDSDDPTQVLETPNLVVIPYDSASKSVQGVVTSQSYLYESLCDLKDWLRVQVGKVQAASHFRMTSMPLCSNLLLDDSSSVLLNQIAMMARPLQSENYFEDRLIQAVMIDQQTICVRDLPAFYACASSLIYKLDSINENKGRQEARFENHFRKLYSRIQTDNDSRDTLEGLQQSMESLLTAVQAKVFDDFRSSLTEEMDFKEQMDKYADQTEALIDLAKESQTGILQSLEMIWSLKTEQVIHALIVLPLEVARLSNSLEFSRQCCESYQTFHSYHLRCPKEAERLIKPKKEAQATLALKLSQLEQLQVESGSKLSDRQQSQLRPLLAFINNLLGEVRRIQDGLKRVGNEAHGKQDQHDRFKDIRERSETIMGLLHASTSLFVPMFNNIVSELFTACCSLLTHVRHFCVALDAVDQRINPNQTLCQTAINLMPAPRPKPNMLQDILRHTAKNSREKELNEKALLWSLKLERLRTGEKDQRALSHIFDYFVRREVAKKLQAEREANATDDRTFVVPFKVHEQAIPEFVGKAMDEWTKEDVARMEREAEQEIENNFPSYFDDVQQQFFSGEMTKDYQRDVSTGRFRKVTVDIETIFAEILEVTKPDSESYFIEYLKDRMEMVKLSLHADKFQKLKRSYSLDSLVCLKLDGTSEPLWQEDTVLLLKKMLGGTSAKSKQIMNITEVNLTNSYNFYHDPYPEEARLVYEPMQNLLIRLRDIVIRDEYESPYLNESIFLASYIVTCFNSEQTPVMKLLTTLEFLLSKLEEWESTYASKRLNSVETEIVTLKMLIIRYRKIQILSWRNLLSWRKDRLIREDVMECCRLAHTVERQVFDLKMYASVEKGGQRRKVLTKHLSAKVGAKLKTDRSIVKEKTVIIKDEEAERSVEAKVFDLLDLFVRDSSLGVYQSRLIFVDFLSKHFTYKLEHQCAKQPAILKNRMTKVINIINFIHSYYGQFEDKLKKTVERLDSAARTKVKTLIDVSKWTVQKFTIVKNNIDKTHRQLNRACKDEEEALLQNVQSLVIASSRKKYANTEDQMLSLHSEHKTPQPLSIYQTIKSEGTCVLSKQMAFMIKNTLEPLLPNQNSLSDATDGFMERLSEVRAINKKYIQVRSYYDLLRFMKVQGLTYSSFDSQQLVIKLIIDHKLFDYATDRKTHLFKTYETYTMLQAASQVDENSHIKNEEVLRMQAFSRSLMLHIFLMNKHLIDSREVIKNLAESKPRKVQITQADAAEIEYLKSVEHLTEDKIAQLKKANAKIQHLYTDTMDRLSLLSYQDDGSMNDKAGKTVTLSNVCQKLSTSLNELKDIDVLEGMTSSKLKSYLEVLQDTITLDIPSKHIRAQLVCSQALKKAQEIGENDLTPGMPYSMMDNIKNGVAFDKSVKQTENLVKICMQKLVTNFQSVQEEHQTTDQASQRKASLTADSNSVTNLNAEVPVAKETDKNSVENQVQQNETSIEQMLAFAKCLKTILTDPKTEKIMTKAKQVFALRGVKYLSSKTRKSIENTYEIVEQLQSCLQESLSRVETFHQSMIKLGYLSQRVFIHLIYQGFCGQEDKDDPDVEPPSDLEAEGEQDGCGLGDGKGGKDNITDQIEHEEQLEGLKNYESEQEDQEEQQDKDDKKEDQGDDEEEDNDFEMKNDFDGEMDSEPEEKDENKQEEDEDDELDDVDDALDNQLWDQNMEDMEQKEKEEAEKNEEEEKEKDKEELDLGDRELDDQNLLDHKQDDDNMAEGDHDDDKQDENPKEQQENDEEAKEAENSEEVEDDGQEDLEKDEEDEDGEPDEIPLDKNEVLADEEEKFSEDAKSQEGDDKSEQDENAEKENTDEMDSQFDEEQGADQEDDDQNMDEDGQDDVDDVQQKPDQAILDDDQIEAKDQQQKDEEKDEKEQANLKRQNETKQEQKDKPENKQNQQDDENQVSQADASGTDLLFDMAKQFQKRQEKKNEQKNKQEQQKEDPDKKQIEEPQMANPDENMENEEQKPQPDDKKQDQDNDGAAEFVFDENQAENIQGKLATDQVEDEEDQKDEIKEEGADGQQPEDMPMDEDEKSKDDKDDADKLNEEDIEKTQAQFKETGVLKPDSKQEQKDKEDKDMNEDDKEEVKQDPRDLIDEYDAYLKAKAEKRMEVDNDDIEDDNAMNLQQAVNNHFIQNLDQFDYMEQKTLIRNRFTEWLTDEREHSQSLQLLAKFKNQTQSVSSSLCEQLRIVLEPQLSQNLQGDFKTGKRLNMKKVISFIASHYRNDKIWLRRTLPSKRDYKILIAIDDSMSMRENSQGFFSLEAMIALTEALNRLEVGKVAVARIRDRMDLVHSFDDTYTSEKAGFIVSQFEFEHQAPTSADSAMANFVCDANKLLDMQNGGNSLAVNCPFVIVLSDGRFNKDNVRRYIREAKEKRYLYIFVILDKQNNQATINIAGQPAQKSQSILNMRSAVKTTEGGGGNSRMTLKPYLSDFPFDYYCIVGDTSELPNALGTILVQWFSMVSAAGPR